MQRSALRKTRVSRSPIASCFWRLFSKALPLRTGPSKRFSRLPVTAEAAHTRICVTISAKRFERNLPNPPFGTSSCSE